MQSRIQSFLEAWANTIIGYFINLAVQLVVYPFYGATFTFGQPIRDGLQSSTDTPNSRRHLNPLFGAWLMGWPSTWVIAEPHASNALATASWRSALRSQLSSFFDEPGLHREAA